jgi:hypothetical protein
MKELQEKEDAVRQQLAITEMYGVVLNARDSAYKYSRN